MLFFPVIIPFGFLVLVMYFYETETVEQERMTGILACFKSRFVAYPLALIFSPVFEAIALVVGYFIITYSIASKNYYNASKTELLFRLIVGNMLCNIIVVTFFIALALLAILLPIAGCFFMVTKVYFIFSRCFKPKPGFVYRKMFG